MARDILGRVCRSAAGVDIAALSPDHGGDEATFRSVLRELEADGYLDRQGEVLQFRSNLLREWWRRHQAPGRTP